MMNRWNDGMTCPLENRLVSLLACGRLVNERVTLFRQPGKPDVCRVTVSTMNDDVMIGDGNSICEALGVLESKLNILAPSKCLGCSMMEE